MTDSTQAWPAGWYADPWFPGQQRWWDGSAWTPHVQAPVPEPVAAHPYPYPAVPMSAADPYPAAPTSVADPYPASAARPAEPYAGAPADPLSSAAAPADPSTDPIAPADPRPDSFAPPWASGSGDGSAGWLAPESTEPPSFVTPPRRRTWWVAVLAACVVVAVAAAAITVATGAGRRHRTVAGPGAAAVPPGRSGSPSTTVPAKSNDPDASVLGGIDVAQADVPGGFTVTLINGGNLVAGQVTLDLCNGTFASEALRTARRQVDLSDSASTTWLSTEAVLYGSAADTAQAFTELKARAAKCPSGYLPPTPGEDGIPNSKTTFNGPPDGSWPTVPGVDRLAYDFTTVDTQGNTTRSVAVYLRRGRALLGVYFSSPLGTQPSVAGKTTVEGIVGVFEQRLAALPTSVVDRTVPVTPPTGSI